MNKAFLLSGLLAGGAVVCAARAEIAGSTILRLHSEGEIPKQFVGTGTFDSLGTYRLSFRARKLPGTTGTCLCAGLEGVNVDVKLTGDWQTHALTFAAPYAASGTARIRYGFGLWNVRGDAEIADVALEPVVTRDAAVAEGALSSRELLLDRTYFYSSNWEGEGRNRMRPLVSHAGVGFNTDRWSFSSEGQLTFRHALAGRLQRAGAVTLTLRYFRKGALNVETSADGAAWQLAQRIPMTNGVVTVALPAASAPTPGRFVRLRAEKATAFQIASYRYRAELEGGSSVWLRGATRFDAVGSNVAPPVATVPEYHRDDYGECLPGDAVLRPWRAHAAWHVSPTRRVPTACADALEVSAAGNETESVQLVLNPTEACEGVTIAVAGDLIGPNGARLAADAVSIAVVGYVPVAIPTDSSTVPGLHPDPLLPQRAPLTLRAGRNQPYWIRVCVPKGMARGTYRGRILVAGRRGGAPFSTGLDLRVRVYGFDLPDTLTCQTLFGYYANRNSTTWRYHGLRTNADLARANDLYRRAMAACHLSDSGAPGQWRVTWKGDEPIFDWTAFDAGATRAFDEYHFNVFRISGGLGLGGGDSDHRREPEIDGVREGDPRYETRLAKLLGGVQRHLEEKGWLDRTLVYCFDEPPERDNAFVMRGFDKLKRYAPKLRRLLTSPCRADLAGGPTVWCPTAPDFDNPEAKLRRAAGDEFWLYVCMQPLAPYVTTFLDHPGVELRTWLWQAWKRQITGVLVWCVNYWNQPAVYPDPAHPQNPYADPMSWNRAGGPYGNGDGRFFYPPRSVFTDPDSPASALAAGPNFDAPVPSMRAEMLRDGLEDYEYLTILRRLRPNDPLLTVPETITRAFDDFSSDPTALTRHRERLAVAIEQAAPLPATPEL